MPDASHISDIPTLALPNGGAMPALGLGTWQLRGQTCEAAVRTALDLGYRHIDTAEMYGNEAEVGQALADSGVPREHVFITTKVWPDHFRATALQKAAADSLARLRTDYVDLLLLHWPSRDVPLEETVPALAEVAERGQARAIGVSNFSIEQLRHASRLTRVPIANNQVELHVLQPQAALVEHARAHGLTVTAYSPLAKGRLTDDPVLSRIAAQHGKTAAQVALRWLVQQGVAVIPKATREPNLRANAQIFDFALSPADLQQLASLA
ncbi:MAG: Oxidoreductase, aldo/keto reductase family [uncultured Chloroflexi bacterium]|uniref:Oxidoreductase, aldo/keto reductase family n=1 Tax=uncultured Chloroflexota bacterium TaxID=166587 RepID=A0A6J4JYR3_9CHLR|nr:MAG: Oxidoreductase, aldo/keto reductase family [uncultured Chloroflexota bacterium]